MSTSTDKCNELLDNVFLKGGNFNYDQALSDLNKMKDSGTITVMEYINLIDALNHRSQDGHYENCLIYKRAQNG